MIRVLYRHNWVLGSCAGLAAAIALMFCSPQIAPAQDAGRAEYEIYRCQHKSATEVEGLLRDLLPDDPSVHLVVDTKSNTLLLRGGPEVQKVATSLLAQVDRPATMAAVRTSGTPVVKAYDCPPGQLDRWLGTVRAICSDRQEIKLTAARESNQLFLLCPRKFTNR